MYSILEQKYRRLQKDLIGGILVLALVISIGTLGYRWLEGWPWLDAAYMTIITLSTVGFSEVRQLDQQGRMFTISLIIMGVIAIGYIVNRFTEALIEGYFQEGLRLRRQRRTIDSLSGHYILCGFGRTGRQIAEEFYDEGIPFVVIDPNVEAIQAARSLGYIGIQGDATLDETLQKVGIDRAVCVVVALPSDAENLYTILSAKTLNPQVRAISRANTEEAVQKLQRGGADAVVSPYITGGRRMAAAALRPQIMDFVDGILTGSNRTFFMEDFLVEADRCPYVGQSLRDARLRSQSGALVVAIRRADGELIVGPMAQTEILPGDRLICIGTAEQLRLLNQLLSPLKAKKTPRPPKQVPPAEESEDEAMGQ